MTFNINVKGGTGAGRRTIRELRRWTCLCGKTLTSYSCRSCGARRDEA